ncbi:MAG: hypothetical protein CO149_07335 [Nitrospirae bacterium CG_4_9_14_3_um_filter_51_5]|nr:MAG: hypothetical protein CO149_07335 [Nitrospirae bacterium CG_4_9_14_3_um_filter_51_5]
MNVAGGIEVVAMEGIELWRPLLGDVDVAQWLPNDRPVLTFHQGIVVAVPGAGCGQCDQQGVQPCNHRRVAVRRAVVGMEGEHHKRTWLAEVFQHRNQIPFADFLHRTDDFELGPLINGIDRVNALHPLEVALVDRIHAQIPRLAIGLGLPAFAETADRGTGLVTVLANMSVPGAVP